MRTYPYDEPYAEPDMLKALVTPYFEGDSILEKLQGRIYELEVGFKSACILLRKVEADRDAIRAKTIEECEQIACDHGVVGIAEAIRALAQVEERTDAT